MADELSVGSIVLATVPYVAWGMLALYVLLGIVLDYHWRKYCVKHGSIAVLRLLYITVGLVAFGLLFSLKSSL